MRRISLFILPLVLVLFGSVANAQDLVPQPETKVWVEGTSNKSDWTVQASEVKAEVAMDDDSINRVKVTIPSAKIVSNKSSIMDRLMRDALQVTEHPVITYELAQEAAGAAKKTFSLKTKGNLTMAGVTRAVDITVEGERLDGGKVRLKGAAPLKMSDFGITPPSAMFGALRTGDDVTVHFEITVEPATS